MSKYRIIKVGDTETYIVQKKFLKFFWRNEMGAIIPIIGLEEARGYKEMFESHDLFNEKAKKPNTLIE